MKKKFELGQIYATRGVSDLADENTAFLIFVVKSLEDYAAGDWGVLCDEDKHENEVALFTGQRLMGAYEFPGEPDWKIWIITEWDRSVTTVLFPDEY